MPAEKDAMIFTASETVKQVRNALKKAFPDTELSTTLQRRNQVATIAVQWRGKVPPDFTAIEKELKAFVGFICIHGKLRLPLWHRRGRGIYHHHQVDCIKYKKETWKEIVVTQEEKGPSWRFWRLTHEEFETKLKPYLNRWKQGNKDILYSVIVKNEVQSSVANTSGITRQTLNNIIKRAFKIYMEANSSPQHQTKSTLEEK